MARIAFMTHWPNGEPTLFNEKIKSCILPFFYPIEKVAPKKHTIRESSHLQKFIGKEVEMFNWTGKPYRSKHHVFIHNVILTGFQEINIKVTRKENNDGIELNHFIKIDKKPLSVEGYETLPLNDGFDSIEQFCSYFKKDFHGFIYHWTDLRY